MTFALWKAAVRPALNHRPTPTVCSVDRLVTQEVLCSDVLGKEVRHDFWVPTLRGKKLPSLSTHKGIPIAVISLLTSNTSVPRLQTSLFIRYWPLTSSWDRFFIKGNRDNPINRSHSVSLFEFAIQITACPPISTWRLLSAMQQWVRS